MSVYFPPLPTHTKLHRGEEHQPTDLGNQTGRGDAPMTLSKSCSDKLALRQCLSLLSSHTSLLISPEHVYLDMLVLPVDQYSEQACTRAFSPWGRMSALTTNVQRPQRSEDEGRPDAVGLFKWSGGYSFKPFPVKSTTTRRFQFARPSRSSFSSPVTTVVQCPTTPAPAPAAVATAEVAADVRFAPCSVSTVWNPHLHENLINGVLLGRRPFDPRGASALCRRMAAKAVLDVLVHYSFSSLEHFPNSSSCSCSSSPSSPSSPHEENDDDDDDDQNKKPSRNTTMYASQKSHPALRCRQEVKHVVTSSALTNWIPNRGDDDFEI